MPPPFAARLTTLMVSAVLSGAAGAQQPGVDAGALLRESQKTPEAPPALKRPEKVEPAAPDAGPRVTVSAFEVVGSTVFGPEVWEEVLGGLVGKTLSFSELQAAAALVSQHYRKAGLHAVAILPEQDLSSGRVRILVVEGKLGALKLSPSGKTKLPDCLIGDMLLEGQSKGRIVDISALERATLIANDVPGLKVGSVLVAGAQPGETDIVANIEPLPLISGNVTVDNQDPRSTGRDKVSAQVALSNLLGAGEQAQVALQGSEGKRYGYLAYTHPLGASGLRGGVSYSRLEYELQGSFASLDGEGSADNTAAFLSYPFIRSQMRNLSGQLRISETHLVNDTSLGNISDNKSRSLTLGVSGNDFGGDDGAAVTIAGANLVVGEVDLSGNAQDLAADAAGPRRDGQFSKLQFNLGRLQPLGDKGTLWLSANGQSAFNNLDSVEEFSLGGANGVRAFPSLEGAGDSGMVATAEYRHELGPTLQPKVFVDWGRVWVNEDNGFAGGAARNAYSLSGAGVGLDWLPSPAITVRAQLAWRLRDNPAAQPDGDDADGSKRSPQAWLQVAMDF